MLLQDGITTVVFVTFKGSQEVVANNVVVFSGFKPPTRGLGTCALRTGDGCEYRNSVMVGDKVVVPQEQVAHHSTQKTANELEHHCHLAYLGKETILDHAQGTVSEVMSE
jgi:hypothetical protein